MPVPSDQPGTTQQAQGLLVIVSGPSGVGKTSIVRGVLARLGGIFSVSATTRPQTANEVDGQDYFFLDEDRFERMLEQGEFLEYARVFGRHWYGTPRGPVQDSLDRGDLLVLDIDVQGAAQVRESMPEALMIFILPPSDDELLRRLRSRGREDESVIQRRFAEAKREIDLARSKDIYDHLIVNNDLEPAIEEMCELIAHRRRG